MGLKRDAHPHPEERACASVSTKRNARARVSKDEDGHGMALMLRDASQHSGGRSSSRPRARKSGLPDLRLLKRPISGKPEIGCDAPQHEGACARRILASQAAARARRTNLRLWETIAGSVSLFPACSLQGTPQLQRVEPSARG